MAETFSNGGVAAVGTGGIDATATTLPTLYRLGMPSSGVFRIRVESEIMKVTTGGQSSSSWTVVRAQEGTTGATHAEGTPISQPLTAQALTDALASAGSGMTNPMTTSGDIIYGASAGTATRLAKGTDGQVLTLASGLPSWASGGGGGGSAEGTFASIPAASGVSGQLYFPSDGDCLLRSTGSVWHTFGPLYQFTPVVDSSFAWLNQGSDATITVSNNEAYLTDFTSGVDALRVRIKTVATGGCQVVAAITPVFPTIAASVAEGGIVIRGSGAGKMITLGVRWDAGVVKLCVNHWDDYATKTGGYTETIQPFAPGSLVWLKIVDAGFDPVRYYWSPDGINWVQSLSENKASFLSSANVNQAGFYYNYSAYTTNRAPVSGVKVLSFVNS